MQCNAPYQSYSYNVCVQVNHLAASKNADRVPWCGKKNNNRKLNLGPHCTGLHCLLMQLLSLCKFLPLFGTCYSMLPEERLLTPIGKVVSHIIMSLTCSHFLHVSVRRASSSLSKLPPYICLYFHLFNNLSIYISVYLSSHLSLF